MTHRDRLIVTRQLAAMIEAELPLDDALEVLEQESPRPVARLLRAARAALKSGAPPRQAIGTLGLRLSLDVLERARSP